MSTSEGKCVLVEAGALISWCIYSYRIVMLLVPYMWASMTFLPAIGCLTYISTATRPDIAAAVGALSQYMSKPSKDHWMGVKRVLRYLKGTLKYGIKFSAQEEKPELFGYSDADWTGDVDTRRSTSGYVFQIGSRTVSWSSS